MAKKIYIVDLDEVGLWINSASVSNLNFNKFVARLGHYEYPKKCVPTRAVSSGVV